MALYISGHEGSILVHFWDLFIFMQGVAGEQNIDQVLYKWGGHKHKETKSIYIF